MGAESRPGRPIGQPVFQKFDAGLPGNGSGERRGSGQQGSAASVVRGLIEQRRGLNLPDINEYVMAWSGLTSLTINSPIAARLGVGIKVTPEVHQMIGHISRGIDFVLFDELGKSQNGRGLQERILEELAEIRQEEGVDRFVLTYQEALLLRDAAAAVNVTYDPGGAGETPENIAKRTFKFADLEWKAFGEEVPEAGRVVDAQK